MQRSRAVEGGLRPAPIVAAIAVAIAALWALLPRETQLRAQSGEDALSLAYLRSLSQSHPGDVELRLSFARALFTAGSPKEARSELAGLRDPRVAPLDFACRVALWREQPGGKDKTAEAGRLAQDLEALVRPQASKDELAALAPFAVELGQPALGARAEELLARGDPAGGHFARAARLFLAAGDPDRAGAASASGALATGDAAQAALALRTLAAARDLPAALRLVRVLADRFPREREVQDEAAAAAEGQGDLALARECAGRALLASGMDEKALRRALQLDLAAGAAVQALPLAQRLVALHPGDAQGREQLAQVAIWAGRPAVALQQWLALARKGDVRARSRALGLARGLHARDLVSELLLEEGAAQPLPPERLGELAESLLDVVDHASAVAAFRRYLAAHPGDAQALAIVGRLQEEGGDLPGALATRREQARRFGAATEVPQAVLLWRMERPAEALALVRRARDRSPARYQLQWKLAWAEEDWTAAREAGEELARQDALEPLLRERLVLLEREAGRLDEMLALARALPPTAAATLFFAADALLGAHRGPDAAALIERAGTSGDGLEIAWLVRARMLEAKGDTQGAAAQYRGAIKLGSGSARLSLVWLAVSSRDPKLLALAGDLCEGDLSQADWAPCALALDAGGRPARALPLYERRARKNPKDDLWLLSWSDALERAGRADAAARLRNFVAGRLAAHPLAALQKDATREQWELLSRAPRLIRDLRGDAEGEAWMRALLASGDARARTLAVGWYLERERAALARHWLSAAGPPTPWQELALALLENDEGKIREVLGRHQSELPPETVANAWVQAGEPGEARAFARRAGLRDPLPARETALHLEAGADQTSGLLTRRTALSVERDLDPVQGLSATGAAELSESRGVLQTRAALSGRLQHGGGAGLVDAQLRVGLLTQPGTLLPELSARVSGPLAPALRGEAAAAWGESTPERGLLHALAVQDAARISLLLSRGARDTASVGLGLRQLRLLRGARLAQGLVVTGELARALSLGSPAVRARLTGLFTANNRSPILPGSGQDVAILRAALPTAYYEVGAGTEAKTVLWGPLSGELDGWSGIAGPGERLALRLQCSLVMSAFSSDLRLGGVFENGGRDGLQWGAGLSLDRRLGW